MKSTRTDRRGWGLAAVVLALGATFGWWPLAPARGADTDEAAVQPAGQPARQGAQVQDGAALFSAGCARLRAGDPAAAIPLLQRAVSRSPEQLEYALKLAQAYLDDGQTGPAGPLLEDLKTRHPKDAGVRTGLARLHAARGDWGAAAGALGEVEADLDAAGILLLAEAWCHSGKPVRATAVLRRGLERFPRDESLWLALIDGASARKRYALALRHIAEAESRLGPRARLHLRAAQAYFGQGEILGKTRIRRVAGARPGRFAGDELLVERRPGRDRFLCCPRASALYQLRRALDAGLDEPEAHLLHARIWKHAGRPKTGFAILKSRATLLLESSAPDEATLGTFAELALAADALSDYLRYSRMRAERRPHDRREILHQTYLALAERFNERGDEAMFLVFLRRASQIRPDDTQLLLRLADGEWAADHHRAAAALYRRVLAAEPAHQARERVLERLAAWEQERDRPR